MAILKRRNVNQDMTLLDLGGLNLRSPADIIAYANGRGIATEPMDVAVVARAFGITVLSFPMEQQKSGYLEKDRDGWIIGVNSLHHPRRQRFTIAHELGHFFLHRNDIDKIDDTILFRADNFGELGIERQANEFAAELLMPRERFVAVVSENGGDIDSIAKVFDVSSLAVSVRAKELGYKEVIE